MKHESYTVALKLIKIIVLFIIGLLAGFYIYMDLIAS